MLPLSELKLMPLGRLAQPFDHPDWLYELKYDGFRALACIHKSKVQLFSRRGDAFRCFPGLEAAIASELMAEEAILDGEIVCLDEQGRPQFNELLHQLGDPVFCAFDLLWLNGKDLQSQPLIRRKARLRRLLRGGGSSLVYVDYVLGKGVELFQAACRMDLEGIVAKWKHGAYLPGARWSSWVKIKNLDYSQGSVVRWVPCWATVLSAVDQLLQIGENALWL